MGGGAFASILGQAAFPRLPPRVYQSLKARYIPRLENLYRRVTVPIEAPEKLSYGDLDLLVAEPKLSPPVGAGTASSTPREALDPASPFISPSVVQEVLGAAHVVECEGNRTSNYAVLVEPGEWGILGHEAEEKVARKEASDGQIYYQIDVHPCIDTSEFERVKFFHSYGDMGMMLGLMSRNIGLRLGQHGLKIPNPPHPLFVLSQNFDEILPFLGLSRETYDAGFKTNEELFKWVSSIRWFNPRYFNRPSSGKHKVKPDRMMYAEFVQWVAGRHLSSTPGSEHPKDETELHQTVKRQALKHFNKTEEYHGMQKVREVQTKIRGVFSGHQVRDWADIGEYWKGVKTIMDEIRRRKGGDDKVLEFYEENGEEALQLLVREVRDNLGIKPVSARNPVGVAEVDVIESVARLSINSNLQRQDHESSSLEPEVNIPKQGGFHT